MQKKKKRNICHFEYIHRDSAIEHIEKVNWIIKSKNVGLICRRMFAVAVLHAMYLSVVLLWFCSNCNFTLLLLCECLETQTHYNTIISFKIVIILIITIISSSSITEVLSRTIVSIWATKEDA